MPTTPLLGFTGLKTSGNPLTRGPGALLRADNVVLTEADEVTQRRGQDLNPDVSFGEVGDKGFTLAGWNDAVLLHYGPTSGIDGDTVAITTDPESTVFSDIGSHEAPHPEKMRMKFAELAKSQYFTTSTGLFSLQSPSGTERAAGVVPAFINGGGVFRAGNSGTGWMAINSSVGYRAVIGRKDSNNIVKLGPPSNRFIGTNPNDVAAGLVRLTNVVTATVVAGHGFVVGDILYISSAGDGNFAAGVSHLHTLTGVTATTLVWASTGSNASLASQTLSSGTKNQTIEVDFPTGLDVIAGDFIQIYRTLETVGFTVDPGDEEFQCYERTITADDISAGFSTIVDTTPDEFLGGPLYTNAATGSPGGLDFTHNQPPLMTDIAVFDSRLWGTQTLDRHILTLRLLGTGAPDGLQAGDKLAIGLKVFTLSGTYSGLPSQNIIDAVNNLTVLFDSLGVAASYPTASVVFNGLSPTGEIAFARRTLTEGVFYAATSRQSAWQDALPLLTAVTEAASVRLANVVTITATAHGFANGQTIALANADGVAVDPNFPAGFKGPITVTGVNTFTYAETGADATMVNEDYSVFALTYGSTQFTRPLRFSEPEEPEAWPLVNFPSGLPDGAVVSRIKSLSGSLYVFLEHGDIYTVSGQYPYSVQRFNGTAHLVCPDTVIEHNARIFALTTMGVVSIGPSGLGQLAGGATAASLDINQTIRKRITKMSAAGQQTTAAAFAVSYESDHQYQLWLPSEDAEISDPATWKAVECFVYHSDSNEWTRWDVNESRAARGFADGGRNHGLVYRTLDLEILVGQTNNLICESKSWSWQDAADGLLPVSCISFSAGVGGTVCHATGGDFDALDVGDVVLFPDKTSFGTVIQSPAGVDELLTDGQYAETGPGDIECWRAISPLAVKWVAASLGAPGIEKHWREAQVHLDLSCIETMIMTLTTERTSDGSPNNVTTVTPGTLVLGADFVNSLSTERFMVATDPARGAIQVVEANFGAFVGDNHTYPTPQAFTQFKLLGLTLTSEGISERTPK